MNNKNRFLMILDQVISINLSLIFMRNGYLYVFKSWYNEFQTSIFKAFKCIQKFISSGAAFHYTRAIFRCLVVMELLSYHQQLCAQKFFQVHSYRKSWSCEYNVFFWIPSEEISRRCLACSSDDVVAELRSTLGDGFDSSGEVENVISSFAPRFLLSVESKSLRLRFSNKSKWWNHCYLAHL